LKALDDLHNPKGFSDIKKIKSKPGYWRLKVGDFRVMK